MSTDLELLTVGRISIDLYCDVLERLLEGTPA